jgi:hypothetical protein
MCIAMRLRDPTKLPKTMWISDSSTPMRSMRVTDNGELVLAGESFEQGSTTDTNSKYETLEKVRGWSGGGDNADELVTRFA